MVRKIELKRKQISQNLLPYARARAFEQQQKAPLLFCLRKTLLYDLARTAKQYYIIRIL